MINSTPMTLVSRVPYRSFYWLALIASFALAACGGSNTPSAEVKNTNPFAQALANEPSQASNKAQPDTPPHPQGDPFKAFLQTQVKELSK
jgi:hypothetical protein